MILRPTRRTSPTLAFLTAIPLALLVACGGGTENEESNTPDPSVTTSETTTETPTTTEAPNETSSPYGLPSDYVAPPGWVESTSRFDDAVGAFVESVDDPRFTAFYWRVEGCCEAGLEATFGSPELPDSDDATDLGDGLYIAAISDWDPADPNWLTMKIWRVVDCDSDDASEVYLCQDGREGFEALETSQTFRVRLDDNFSVQMSAILEPVGDDEYFTSYSWLGQGPAFATFLSELHAAYSVEAIQPYRSGETLSGIATANSDQSGFRVVALDGPWAPFGLWQQPGGPAFTYMTSFDNPESWVPMCFDSKFCVDNGNPGEAPLAFETLIGPRASLHVVRGRMAFLLRGATLGG